MKIQPTHTDAGVLRELGERLRQARLARNQTQAEISAEAGISAPTLANLEEGRGTQLVTLIRVLRTLDLLPGLDLLVPERGPSPLDQVRRHGRERRRASATRPRPAPPAQGAPWRWGDERNEEAG